jgi:hypothetical protein
VVTVKESRIILAALLVSFAVGFVYFQIEKKCWVRREGEKILEGLLMCAGSLNASAPPQSGLTTSVGPLTCESCAEAALFSFGGERMWKSGGWNDSDEVHLASFLGTKNRTGMSLVTAPGANGSDSDYVYSLYPFLQNGERVGFLALRQRVSSVRASLWSCFGRTAGVSTAAGLLVAGSSLLMIRSARKGERHWKGKLPPCQLLR